MGDKSPRLHHLDLSRRRGNLEGIFDSVINKLPDLSMRPITRLADEDDYFNVTPFVKLEPFRRQRVFEKCISPELEARSSPTITTASPSLRSLTPTFTSISGSRQSTPTHSRSVNNRSSSPRLKNYEEQQSLLIGGAPVDSLRKNLKVSFGLSTGDQQRQSFNSSLSNKRLVDSESINKLKKPLKTTKLQMENKQKLEQRNTLLERYSHLKVDTPTSSLMLEEKLFNSSYDRLMRRSGGNRKSSNNFGRKEGCDVRGLVQNGYPYANPMPECMLTDDNIDNLHDIIVSSHQIEWKMLTPLRPSTDYEEKFFDKLINLHRLRYRSRVDELASFSPSTSFSTSSARSKSKVISENQSKQFSFAIPNSSPVVFRHTRHASSMRHQSHLYDYHLTASSNKTNNRQQVGRNVGMSTFRQRGDPVKVQQGFKRFKVMANASETNTRRRGSNFSMGVKVRSKFRRTSSQFNNNNNNNYLISVKSRQKQHLYQQQVSLNQRKWSSQSIDRLGLTLEPRVVPTLTLTTSDDNEFEGAEDKSGAIDRKTNQNAEANTSFRSSEQMVVSSSSGTLDSIGGDAGRKLTSAMDLPAQFREFSGGNPTSSKGITNRSSLDFELSFQDDFSYEDYSRFSKQRNRHLNLRGEGRGGDKSTIDQVDESNSNPNNDINSTNPHVTDIEEDEVDEIMSHLMSATSMAPR